MLLAAVNAKYIHSNLAVYSLKAYARSIGKRLRSQSITINQTIDDILTDIYLKQPDVLCISCYLWNITYTGQLVAEIPKILPHTQIWLGGPEVSYDAEDVLRDIPVRQASCAGREKLYSWN